MSHAPPAPLVSVLVRTHAGSRGFLPQCLASITAQIYRPLEIVVVEDGSDQSRSIVDRATAGSGVNVQYCALPKSGRCIVGNTALKLARGSWCVFLDDDDQFLPQHVEVLVAAVLAAPECRAAYSKSWMIPTIIESRDPLQVRELERIEFRAAPFSRWMLWELNPFPIQACLFQRTLFETHGGFDVTQPLLEDWELWIRYLSCESVTFVEQVTSWFRVPGEPRVYDERIRELSRHIQVVQAKCARLQMPFTVREILDAAEAQLTQALRQSPVVSALAQQMHRVPGLKRLGASLAGMCASSLEYYEKLRGLAPKVDPRSARLQRFFALCAASQLDEPLELTIAEARWIMHRLWAGQAPDHAALLRLQDIVVRSGLATWLPIRLLQRRLSTT